jgi:glycosyltransferase involved in cell wall biosynthesis
MGRNRVSEKKIIGVFSKLGSSGGSEHRCAELANGIVRYTDYDCWLLCEERLNEKVAARLDKQVRVVRNVFKPRPRNVSELYGVHHLLVVNSDSYSFAKRDYWEGKMEKHHKTFVDIGRIPQFVFLFNFVITPAKHLHTIAQKCKDVRIICANRCFFQEMSEKPDKFRHVRHLPRAILHSPVDPATISTEKTPSEKIRIGRHSKAFGYKFNDEHGELISRIGRKYADRVKWDFLGVPRSAAEKLRGVPNLRIRPEYSISVKEYLEGIDIFLFFISWKRDEPWSRAVAEGLASGCPVIATNRAGNIDQVIPGNNGYLCSTLDEFEESLSSLIENPDRIRMLGKNGMLQSRIFTTEEVIRKLMLFIR